MSEQPVVQKLLSVDVAARITNQGCEEVGGVVTLASDARCLTTPAMVMGAYGFDQAPEYVDVVRFRLPFAAVLHASTDSDVRPWPTYPSGFLRSVGECVVPVWCLDWTRYSSGAEYWRIAADGAQRILSSYRGVALGWAGARTWNPPSRWVGCRAVWQGAEYAADVVGDMVDITALSDPSDSSWEQRRLGTWSRTVPLSQCEVFELICTARVDGVPVRVLAVASGVARVQVIGSDPVLATRIGASMIDQGIFENPTVPITNITDMQVTQNKPPANHE